MKVVLYLSVVVIVASVIGFGTGASAEEPLEVLPTGGPVDVNCPQKYNLNCTGTVEVTCVSV